VRTGRGPRSRAARRCRCRLQADLRIRSVSDLPPSDGRRWSWLGAGGGGGWGPWEVSDESRRMNALGVTVSGACLSSNNGSPNGPDGCRQAKGKSQRFNEQVALYAECNELNSGA